MAKYSDRKYDLKCIESGRFRANCWLNIECECMESISSLSRDKGENKPGRKSKYCDRILDAFRADLAEFLGSYAANDYFDRTIRK